MLFNMGPRGDGIDGLDAQASAAAGRKLTLKQGLGAEFSYAE
jgi:hypothetical protein